MEKNLMKPVEIAERVRVIFTSFLQVKNVQLPKTYHLKLFIHKKDKSFMIDKT